MPLITPEQKKKLKEIKVNLSAHYLFIEEVLTEVQQKSDDEDEDGVRDEVETNLQELVDDLNTVEDKMTELLR